MIWLTQLFTWVVKKCLNLTSKSIFYDKNHSNLSDFFFHWRISVYKDVFCYYYFLKTSIFEPLCFLKWCPIFDSPCEHLQKSNKKMVFILLIFCKNILPFDQVTSAKLRSHYLFLYFCKNLGGLGTIFSHLPPEPLVPTSLLFREHSWSSAELPRCRCLFRLHLPPPSKFKNVELACHGIWFLHIGQNMIKKNSVIGMWLVSLLF